MAESDEHTCAVARHDIEDAFQVLSELLDTAFVAGERDLELCSAGSVQ